MAIRWEPGKHSSMNGYVGDLRMFTVHYDSTRNGISFYTTDSDIPAPLHANPNHRHSGVEAAQEHCEGILQVYVDYLVRHVKGIS